MHGIELTEVDGSTDRETRSDDPKPMRIYPHGMKSALIYIYIETLFDTQGAE